MSSRPRSAAPLIAVVAIVLAAGPLSAQTDRLSASQEAFFEKNIRPALVTYCYECHSLESGTTRGGLLVDTHEGLLTGGDSGPAINPGSLNDNVFWDAINWDGYEMPPSRKMPADVIANFKTWIEMGAPDPRVRERAVFKSKMTPEVIEEGKQHWAFQPPSSAGRSSIDEYIDDSLKREGLEPVSSADGATLLRRLHFDLVGLPPTPAEVLAFQRAWNRNSTAAIESKVDELLSRTQFGERWGRHWLDVARYADSSGGINVAFPHAWRYRDYVIDSFNDDTPYDQFIREQIAGDLLPAKTDEQWQRNLIATGFLAVGMKRLDERNPRKFTMDMVDEQIDTVTQSVLGMTVACARCHDHKSDPIPTADYYSLAGIFLSTNTLYGTVWGQQNHRPSDLILLPILDKKPRERGESIPEINAQIAQLQAEMRRMSAAARESGERVQRDFVQMRNRIAALEGKLATLNPDGSAKTFGMGAQEAGKPINASILVGGEVERPAQEVPRGFLQVLDDVASRPIKQTASGRRELADWLTSEDNPLTARVMANRVWMKLFGTPIVESPNNWGPTGMQPTHPELLDYLALQFVKHDWSVKQLIRQIVLSDAYQRSSDFHAKNADVDPDNKLLWRMSPRQLDAESMRDAMLAVGGNLDPSRPRSVVGDNGTGRLDRGPRSEGRLEAQTNHRSVYLPVVRDSVHESLELFGFPDPNSTSDGRRDSIVPTQALYVMNGEFVIGQAGEMADAMLKASRDRSEQIEWAFLAAYGRPASSDEVVASSRFISEMSRSGTTSSRVPSMTITPARQPRPGMNGPRGGPGGRGPRGATPGSGGAGGREPGMRRRGGPAAEGGRPAAQRGSQQPPRNAEQPRNAGQQALALFCQTLLASAEFRILD